MGMQGAKGWAEAVTVVIAVLANGVLYTGETRVFGKWLNRGDT